MRGVGLLMVTIMVLAVPMGFSQSASADFQSWKAAERAVMEAAGQSCVVDPFVIRRIPLGWVLSGHKKLAYYGHRPAVDAQPIASAVLRISPPDAESMAWPSAFSGWDTVALPSLWAQRMRLPQPDQRQLLILRIPATDAVLTLEVNCEEDAGIWPDFLKGLAETLAYAGPGHVLVPPSNAVPEKEGTRSATRSPTLDVRADALSGSPLHDYTARLRQALHQGSDPAENNHAVLLENGFDAMLARLHLIRSARHAIRMQTFIWSNDEAGRLLLYELIQAAHRGVNVQIIADHIASFRDVELAAFVSTAHTNLMFRHYRPAANRIDPAPLQEAVDFLIPNDTNQRMHNKLLVVDNAVAITGGRNVENTYYAQATGLNFKDRDVLFTGPMVSYALQSFAAYWDFDETERTERLTDVRRVIRSGKFRRRETRDAFDLDDRFDAVCRAADDPEVVRVRLVDRIRPVAKALFLADPPGKASRVYTAWRRGTIARQLELMMKSARHSLVLQTPYLVLDGGMFKIFKELRETNPEIQLLMSSNSLGATDNALVYAAGFKMRRSYFKAGLDVFEYKQHPSALLDQIPDLEALRRRGAAVRSSGGGDAGRDPFLCIHAKSMVIDETVSYVGSYNFDPRSISLNTEVGLLVQDPGFAAAVMKNILADIQPGNSWVIARRERPRSAEDVQRTMPEDLETTRAAIDLWPFRNTAGYALKAGSAPQVPGSASFYQHYEDIGPFPGVEERLATKRIITCLSTLLAGLAVPLL